MLDEVFRKGVVTKEGLVGGGDVLIVAVTHTSSPSHTQTDKEPSSIFV